MINSDHIARIRQLVEDKLSDDIWELIQSYCDEHELPADYLLYRVHIGINTDHLTKQPALCDCYSGGLAIALWPSGKVQLFPGLAEALTMLSKKHHEYVAKTPNEAWSLYRDFGDDYQDKLKADDEHVSSPAALWQYLLDIAVERNPWAKNMRGAPSASDRMSKRNTASGYKISHAKCQAAATAKLPKQAKVLAEAFLEFEDGSNVFDEDINKLLQQKAAVGVLKTKQDVMRIFAYYRKALIEYGAIELRI